MRHPYIQKAILTVSRGRGLLRGVRALAWRMGAPLVAEQLAIGTNESVRAYYDSRVTDCNFLEDPAHYERPRVQWILDVVRGGRLLEIGCGNGGMTKQVARQVQAVTAMDVSAVSLAVLRNRELPNVQIVEGLVEEVCLTERYQWIVLSEVIEHVREPASVLARCLSWLAPGGQLLITTPNGPWQSEEHLHEFDMPSFVHLLSTLEADALSARYICDQAGTRRWLGGIVTGDDRRCP